MDIKWDFEKNVFLKITRGVCFEDLLSSRYIGIEKHPSREHQWLMLFEYHQYVWVVPFVVAENCYFLKTAFASRKHTKKYMGGKLS
jgi:hypothetical protein